MVNFGGWLTDTGWIDFFSKLFQGRLYSELYQENVFTLIADRWHVTFALNILSVIIAWAVAIPLRYSLCTPNWELLKTK